MGWQRGGCKSCELSDGCGPWDSGATCPETRAPKSAGVQSSEPFAVSHRPKPADPALMLTCSRADIRALGVDGRILKVSCCAVVRSVPGLSQGREADSYYMMA